MCDDAHNSSMNNEAKSASQEFWTSFGLLSLLVWVPVAWGGVLLAMIALGDSVMGDGGVAVAGFVWLVLSMIGLCFAGAMGWIEGDDGR